MRGATLFSRAAAVLTILLAMTACGGGGGSGAGFLGEEDTVISITLLDPLGEETTQVTPNKPGTFRVKVSANNNENLVVTGSVTSGQLVSDNALTDASGVALFQVEAGAERGAATFTATVTSGAATATETLGFQVGELGLRLGYFDNSGGFIEGQIKTIPNATLAATGSAELSVAIVTADDTRVTTPVEISFLSGCISGGQATLSPESPVTSVSGIATIQYQPNGCTGSDQITASLVGSSSQAFGTLIIASAQANAIEFVSAEPALIVLRGTGGAGRDETADVQFRVVDGNGVPLNGVRIDFSLSTEVGGLSVAPAVGFTNAEGLVGTTASAGDVATSVRVVASVGDGNGGQIATASDIIVVSTGLPDQNSISLSISDTFVVTGGFRVDGQRRTITVRMADKFNNPVVNGTAAVFTTELGAIDPACQTGVANGERLGGTPEIGTCSVLWTSQEPRLPTLTGGAFLRTIFDPDYSCPDHNGTFGACPGFLGYSMGGRSTILVHAIGEESFVDRNGNGRMDQDEADLVENLAEASIDHNEDGVYTPADPECLADPTTPRCIAGQEEIFIDFDNDSTYDFNDDPAVYNGLLCPLEGDGVWCSRTLVNVRDQGVVVLSADPDFDILVARESNSLIIDKDLDRLRADRLYDVFVADIFNNPPAGGSTISYSTVGNCQILGLSSFIVPNTSRNGAYGTPLRIILPDPDDNIVGSVIITLTLSGDGGTIEEAYNCEAGILISPDP